MNSRLVILLFLVCGGWFTTHGQYAWYHDFKGISFVGTYKLSVDNQDNVLVVGSFLNDIEILGVKFSAGGAFISKFNKDGGLLWIKRIIFDDINSAFPHIRTDGTGNIYIAGSYYLSMTIENVTLQGSPYIYNSFVAKLNSIGNLVWAKNFPGIQELRSLDVNEAGETVVHGILAHGITLGPAMLPGSGNGFGVLYSSSGAVIWAKEFETISSGTTDAQGTAIDKQGNTYFCGRLTGGSIKIDSKEIVADGNYALFFTKIDKQGNCVWLQSGIRTLEPGFSNDVEFGDLSTDDAGNVYAFGTYWKQVEFGNILLPGDPLKPNNYNFFLVKFDVNGNPDWARSMLEPEQESYSASENVVIHNNKVYVGGLVGYTPYFSSYDIDGVRLGDPVKLPFMGDLAGGLGVDSENSVYVSGRRYPEDVNKAVNGFVLKYNGSENPENPGDILAPQSICITDDEALLTTRAISNTTGYEWEIVFNGTTTTMQTTNPDIKIVLSSLGISGSFSVRVRGLNAGGAGNYSGVFNMIVDKPGDNFHLVADCAEISVMEQADYTWYVNNELHAKFGTGEQKIYPADSGHFHVEMATACGIKKSNVIDFKPYDLPYLFVPNVITPNTGDFNEVFVIDEALTHSRLLVLNRWGAEVYQSPDYQNDWDGDDLPSGVYFYSIENKCIPEGLTGIISIIR